MCSYDNLCTGCCKTVFRSITTRLARHSTRSMNWGLQGVFPSFYRFFTCVVLCAVFGCVLLLKPHAVDVRSFELDTHAYSESLQSVEARAGEDICSNPLLDGGTDTGRFWLNQTKNREGFKARGYLDIDTQMHAECASACVNVLRERRQIWIAGPPGSGKTTVTKRLQLYGFTVAECEALVGGKRNEHFDRLTNLTRIAATYGTSAFVLSACYSEFLTRAPPGVDRVLLLPRKDVYDRRWRARDPNDKQDHDGSYARATEVSKERDIITIFQNDDECVDKTIVRICTALHSIF